jgi:hypothetical protein
MKDKRGRELVVGQRVRDQAGRIGRVSKVGRKYILVAYGMAWLDELRERPDDIEIVDNKNRLTTPRRPA